MVNSGFLGEAYYLCSYINHKKVQALKYVISKNIETKNCSLTSQMFLPAELLELLSRGAVGKICIATNPASSACR